MEFAKNIDNCDQNDNDYNNVSFLCKKLENIKDYDQLDMDIIMSLENINTTYSNENINIILDNLFYEKSLLSDYEFNQLLYDISNDNIKNINELVEYHKKFILCTCNI